MAGQLAQRIAKSAEVQPKTVVDNAREIRIVRLYHVRKNIIEDMQTLKELQKQIDEELKRLGIDPILNRSKLKN